jgi:4'-phosphopantetheinyl transferase
MLSPQELARGARFHLTRDRQNFIATRAWLRMILARYLGCEPAALKFHYSENDKPCLDPSFADDPTFAEKKIEFNVSHSGTVALLAFARARAVGVDIEQVRDNFEPDAIAGRFFSEHEQRQLEGLSSSEKYLAFFRCWTRKEAYIKARGTGLSLPLDQFDVSIKPEDENALLATRPDASEAARWSLRGLQAGDGYIAALCVRGQGWRLIV